jgi:hypothetical protein
MVSEQEFERVEAHRTAPSPHTSCLFNILKLSLNTLNCSFNTRKTAVVTPKLPLYPSVLSNFSFATLKPAESTLSIVTYFPGRHALHTHAGFPYSRSDGTVWWEPDAGQTRHAVCLCVGRQDNEERTMRKGQ